MINQPEFKEHHKCFEISSQQSLHILQDTGLRSGRIVSTYRLTHGSATKAALCGIV